MAKPKTYANFSLSNPPPPGHKELGEFVEALFQEAQKERDRLELPNRWRGGYALMAGKHFSTASSTSRARPKMMFNLVFSFINRTVANLTSRTPVAEAKPIGGARPVRLYLDDESDSLRWERMDEETMATLSPEERAMVEEKAAETPMLLNTVMKDWWTNTEQNRLLAATANNMEINGCAWEKHTFDRDAGMPVTTPLDCFSVFPQPGNWKDVSTETAYFIHAYPVEVSRAQELWDNTDICAEEKYDLLGDDRDTYRPPRNEPSPSGASSHYSSSYRPNANRYLDRDRGNCMVVECWIRDYANTWTYEETTEVETVDPETGEVTTETVTIKEQRKYPGGIRVIQTCNEGKIVLSDMPNPQINHNIPEELSSNSYGWDHFPFTVGVSYYDPQSIWGISAPEQVADIQLRINELLTRLIHYLNLMVWPILILPRDTMIKPSSLNNRAGAILRPMSTASSQGIRFLQPAHLTESFWQAYHTLMDMFGRIYAIEDIDRGEAPSGVVAASAISALQERNAVLMRHKVGMMDYFVRERGRFAVSGFQNFGIYPKEVDVDGETKRFRGVELIGQRYNYVVESGSAITRTVKQDQELMMALWERGIIPDPSIIIENLDIPDKRKILERLGETQLDLAANILVQAGYQPGIQLPDGTITPPLEELLAVLQAPQYGPPKGSQQGLHQAISPDGGTTAAPTPHAPLAEQGQLGIGEG